MKKRLFTFTAVFCITVTSSAQSSSASHTARSSTTSGTDKTSSAVCQMTFDAAGHRTMTMTKSSGSKVLDDYIMNTEGHILNGLRNTTLPISIACKNIEVSTPHGKEIVRIVAIRPPYPYQARARHEQGIGAVKASFDEKGNVATAVMAQSTGSKILDGNTVYYAMKGWKSSGGEKVTTIIPVAYQLR